MYKIIVILFIAISFNGCVADLKLDEGSVIVSSLKCYQNKDTVLTTLPTYGAIGDSLTISLAKNAKKDEGISEAIKLQINQGSKYFAFYSKSNEKMSSILNAALSKFKNNELSGVYICYIGAKEFSNTLEKEMKRAGATYKNINE
jgi:hypothetical protein